MSKNKNKNTETENLLWALVTTKSSILLLLFIIFGFILVYLSTLLSIDKYKVLSLILFAIGTSFIAAAVFSVMQFILTSKEQAHFLGEIIEQKFKALEKSIIGQVMERQAFNPTDIYPSSNRSNKFFLSNFINDLSTSSVFYFKGVTSKFAAAQLLKSAGSLEQVFFIIPSLNNPTIDERSKLQTFEPNKKKIEVQKNKILKDLIVALVGLHSKVRFKSRKITICITNLVYIDRYELTDSSLYLQMFDEGTREKHHKFPTAYRFSVTSEIYQHYRREFLALVDSCNVQFELTQDTTDEDYYSFLEANYETLFDRGNVEELKNKFEKFANKLAVHASKT